MSARNIPLIIPSFNQLSYLINLINWWNYYTGGNQVFVIDNNSNYKPLLRFLKNVRKMFPNVEVVICPVNNLGDNLRKFIDERIKPGGYKYYCISNPDIMPCPSTPENFLEIFQYIIENYGFHRVGFALKLNDIPDYVDNYQDILKRQKGFYDNKNKCIITYMSHAYKGYKAAIDLTFAMYTTKNTGWQYPMNRIHFANALRIFQAFHLAWYIHPHTRIKEHEAYFKNAIMRKPGHNGQKGINYWKPKKYRKNAAT